MKCPDCQFENRDGAKFCLKCGRKLELKCHQCGKNLPIYAIFCEECGQKLIETVETGVKDPTTDREAFNKTTLYILNGVYKGKSFDIKDDTTHIGRSPDNDIQIEDISVSRRHLAINRKAEKFFIIDLESETGTFVNGNPITPGIEFEVREGILIIIGMSVICLGEHCLEYDMPFLDNIELSTELSKNDQIPVQHRTMTVQKNMEFIYKVNNVLSKSLDLDNILKGILDCVMDLLKRTDRGAIIVIDESGRLLKGKIKSRTSKTYTAQTISRDVLKQVLRSQKSVLVLDSHNEEDADLSDTLKLSKIRSTICVPLISICNSKVMGAIYVDSLEKPYGFRKEDISLLTEVSSRAAAPIENSILYEFIKENK